MPPEHHGVRVQVVHGAYGLMYAVAVLAGVYGLSHPGGQVQNLYGSSGNRTILFLMIFGGVIGLLAYAFRKTRLELVGVPVLFCATAFVAPALFVAEYKGHDVAWYGWLSVALALSFVARWDEVRALRTHQREMEYRGVHGK